VRRGLKSSTALNKGYFFFGSLILFLSLINFIGTNRHPLIRGDFFVPLGSISKEGLKCLFMEGFNLQPWPKAKRPSDGRQCGKAADQAKTCFCAGPSDPTNGSRRSEASNSELPNVAPAEGGRPQKAKKSKVY